MFSPRVCFISTALPYVQDSFKELVPMWMLPPETPHKFFCCKSWMWRRGGRFAVRWRSCGLLSFRVPVHTDTLYAHHVGGCRGATMPITSLLHFPPVLSTPPKPPTHLSTPPPPLFHSHIRPEVRQPCLQNSQSQYCVRDRAIHYGENKVLSVSSALGHQLKTSRQHRGTEGGGGGWGGDRPYQSRCIKY